MFSAVILQIILVDAVFSFDSILTAIGLIDNVVIMIIAVIISMIIMMIFASPISNFINKHPTLQILALSFLIMIGVMLVAEGYTDNDQGRGDRQACRNAAARKQRLVVLFSPNGTLYVTNAEGEWSGGLPNGRGTSRINGRQNSGIWEDGCLAEEDSDYNFWSVFMTTSSECGFE